MAGKVVVSTLNNDTGVLATQNGMTGIARAWVNFNGQGTVAIRDSFNVSSITDNGTGDYTVNFTTAMPNANYSYNVSCTFNLGVNLGSLIGLNVNASTGTEVAPTTSACRFALYGLNTNNFDSKYVCVAVFSS